MASNLESPTRSRSQHKQKRNENMEEETNSKEDALERSVEEIRFKMKEKRRKKVQADLSLSRSRYKNANLVLKASLRHNNRNLAKSLETARNECRQAQNDLVELQRERHLLQSVVNRFQDQHVKQRNQIKGVHETLRKVTSSLMDTVGLLGQAMDMCVIPRHTKDRSLGLVFRTSSLTSDDLSDLETKEEGGSSSVETSSHILSSIPRRIPANRDNIIQSPAKSTPSTEEIEDLPDIDVPLLFVSNKSAPQGRERNRRDPKKISAGNQKLSRRTSSLLDPATIAAMATEIEKSAENIRTVLEETDDDGECSNKGQAFICIDDEMRAPSEEIEGVKSAEEKQDRRVTQKRSGRLSLRKEGEAAEHGHIEEKENEIVQIAEESQGRRTSKKKSGRSSSRKEVEASEYDPTEDIVSSLNKDIEVPLDDDHKRKGGKRKSKQLSKERKIYVCPDDDEDEVVEKAECMELDLEDEEIVERSSSRRGSRKRSGRLSRRRETFVKEDSDLKTLEIDDDLQEIQILDDVDDDAAVGSKLDGPNQQVDDAEEVLDDFQQKRESKTCLSGEEASRTSEKQSEKADRKIKKKKDKAVKKKKNNTKDTDLDHGHLIEGLMEADQLDVVSGLQHDRHEGKLQQNTVPDQRRERVKDDNIAEKSDYRIVDMELTTAASGHISVIEGADLQTKSNEKTRDDEAEKSQMSNPGSSSEVSSKEKPKSRLPVLVKGKSKPSKLKKSMHKVQSKMGTNKDSIRRRDEKDVQQMTIFDLSMGDSFSHPTPSRLITKAQNAAGSKADETVEKNGAVCRPTTGRGSGDGLEKIAQAESSNDVEAEEALVTQDSETHGQSQEIIREERHSKIKRKSRKSKSVVTPGAAEQKVRLSEKALLEELSNLDASYLSDVTNPERKSKIGASLPSRKSSLKDGGESLNDLMVRPHHRKTSKRKLSKRNFYFGESESEEGHTQSKAEGRSEARGSELNASVLDPDMPYPDSASALPKSFSSCLNTTTDILEDLENVLLEQAKPRESKKIHRRTTILKSSGQSSRGASNLNVTFVMDDEGDFEAVKKDKASKTTQNPCLSTAKTSKAKDLNKQANIKTFVAGNAADVFFGNFDDANIEGEDEVDDEVEDVTAETVTSKQSTTAAVQPSAGNQQCTIGSRTEKEDVLQALGRSSSKTVAGRLDEPEANKNKENEEHKNKKKVKTDSDALSVSLQDNAEKQTSKNSSVQAASKAEVSSAANDEIGASDRSSNKTQDNQPDESEPERKDEEKKEARVQKTNKRKAKADDDDILDHKPSKVAKADAESVPEVPERRGRRSKAVSYKEPSLNSKLRQGDPNTCSVYKDLAVKTTKKGKARAPLSNITN